MRHMVNGCVVELTPEPDGTIRSDALRKAAGIPEDRQLILQTPDGKNRVINPGESLPLRPDQFFLDAPAHIRGSSHQQPARPHIPVDGSESEGSWDEGDGGPEDDDDRDEDDDDPEDDDDWDEEDDWGEDYDESEDEEDWGDDPDDEDAWYEDDGPRDVYQSLDELSHFFPLWVDDAYRFVIVQKVKLPTGYNQQKTSILVELPADYPSSPPGIGKYRIYVSPTLRFYGRRLKDVHEGTTPIYLTPGFGPWAWFCYQTINWDPLEDDLIVLLEMIRADLTDPPTV